MKGILYELYRYAICEPGVDEWNAPPLNASNLNDISNALQAVNITQQERTTLGAEATDTLGQILAALKNATDESIENINQDVEEIQQTMGNVKCVYGSYVGNGQTTLTITLGFRPRYVCMLSDNYQQNQGNNNLYVLVEWIYNNQTAKSIGSNVNFVDITISNNGFSLKTNSTNYIGEILNNNGEKVHYMAFE